MKTIGNFIWLVFGGWVAGLLHLAGTMFFFPLAPYLFPYIGYVLWPFGREPVSRNAIAKYKVLHPGEFALEDGAESKVKVSESLRKTLGVIWSLTLGPLLALFYAFFALLNIPLFATLVLIPVAIANITGWLKIARISLNPFASRIVHSALAEDINKELARANL